MLYVLLIIVALLVAVLLLRIRVRFVWSDTERLMFVGLGRSGQLLDFRGRTGSVRVCGITVSRFPLDRKRKETDDEKPPAKTRSRRRKWFRRMNWPLLRRTVPIISRELRRFAHGLLRALIIEELEANVRAGFESPDLTGMAYGYYQAAMGMAPTLVGRVRFIPDWTGESLSASARAGVALPLYKLLWRVGVLLWRLPLWDLKKLTIGHKEGRT